MPLSSGTASSNFAARDSLPQLFGAPHGGAAQLAPYKRFGLAKTLAQAEFTSAEHVKAILGPTGGLPHGAMREASKMLEFEYAAVLRDRIIKLRGQG